MMMLLLQAAAGAVATTTTTLSPEPTVSNEFMSTITASTLAVSIIQWLKNTKLVPFINENSTTLNRWVSWLAAFVSGAGIHFTFNHDAGVLTVTGLTAGVIIHTVTVTCKQYAVQWLIYRGVLKGPAIAAGGAEAPAVGQNP